MVHWREEKTDVNKTKTANKQRTKEDKTEGTFLSSVCPSSVDKEGQERCEKCMTRDEGSKSGRPPQGYMNTTKTKVCEIVGDEKIGTRVS